jgi:hypothetical protein
MSTGKNYKGWRLIDGKREGESVVVQANNSLEAGAKCATVFAENGHIGIDPFTIDIEETILTLKPKRAVQAATNSARTGGLASINLPDKDKIYLRGPNRAFHITHGLTIQQIRKALTKKFPKAAHCPYTRSTAPDGSNEWVFQL